jgi:hypothetical protein
VSVSAEVIVAVGAGGHGLQLEQLLDDLLLARVGTRDPGLVGVHLRVASELVKARVAFAGALRGLRVGRVEELDHRLHRAMEAVQVEPVEADLLRSPRQGVVAFA